MQACFGDEEGMTKKDDDRKPGKLGPSWHLGRIPPRRTLKRLALFLLFAASVYLFIKHIPTDVPIRDRRHPVYTYSDLPDKQSSGPLRAPPRRPPAQPKKDDTASARQPSAVTAHNFNGPLKFYNLASTLHAITNTRGGSSANKNVLFAASSLKSAATLLPVACQMGTELRSYVHFALMSRDDISIDDLQAINGIDDSCHIIFHDARPDQAASSSDARLAKTVERALFHINMYMHPQVILVDSSHVEEPVFLDAMRARTAGVGITLIELPEHSKDSLAWLTKLDSSSLAAWNKITIDILIHAHAGASGSLVRLLRSLKSADFGGFSVPHLTIELPQDVDLPTERFLESFQWPPAHVYNPTNVRQLSLRHRIPRHGVSEEESSVRFLESFWPAHPKYSHILVLSPQVELSPHFFHYLRYAILEYKYSTAALLQEWDRRLLGISLDLPSTYLNGSGGFAPPEKLETSELSAKRISDELTSFLWQAPNSDAALFLGEKWVELHGFVSQLLEIQRDLPSPPPDALANKAVSKKHPSWLEHVLRLSRARGYWTLYPSAATVPSVAAVHNELYRPPEEYEKVVDELAPGDSNSNADTSSGETTLASGTSSLLAALPNGGTLPPFNDLPLLSWDGSKSSLQQLNEDALAYAAEWRRTVGGCPKEKVRAMPQASAKDLFCKRDE
ncbi:Glycosyltransferase 2 [Pleurostoma richardsiae]|uniref:Glycosyltransferase 2 n=1 Tax=Pleurostoma richardsiae TaxID=41990 RepID=A0AA38R9S4_9PEZI|nr:Glycosyltransferase 2 [Pleurostoma richardsiae]